ncbi:MULTISPECIES: hypothetical protein [unclassified Streptomyces]|uniref:hypothetical protein n=1 Tax=unclassified Streptomyces TaxID=2593676 RepID=UPI0036EFF644
MTARTWLITGVSSGFGRAPTARLLERGDRVIGTVRSAAKVADLRITAFEAQRELARSTDFPAGE